MEAVAYCAGVLSCVLLYLFVAALNTWQGGEDEDRQEERYRSLLARWLKTCATPCNECYDGHLDQLASETREVLR